jgi:hypothetical protein
LVGGSTPPGASISFNRSQHVALQHALTLQDALLLPCQGKT